MWIYELSLNELRNVIAAIIRLTIKMGKKKVMKIFEVVHQRFLTTFREFSVIPNQISAGEANVGKIEKVNKKDGKTRSRQRPIVKWTHEDSISLLEYARNRISSFEVR